MGIYDTKDLKTSDDGELDMDSGDLVLADSHQSARQLMINYVNSNPGDFVGMPLFGWSVYSFVGRRNDELTRSQMEDSINNGLIYLTDMIPDDIDFIVAPLDAETIGIVGHHAGIFLDDDGREITTSTVLGWNYPIKTGRIMREDDDTDEE